MKIYVDEVPENCEKCDLRKLRILSPEEHRLVKASIIRFKINCIFSDSFSFEGQEVSDLSVRHEECPLKSADKHIHYQDVGGFGHTGLPSYPIAKQT